MDSPHRWAVQSEFALAPDSSSAEVAVTPLPVRDSSDSFSSRKSSGSPLVPPELALFHFHFFENAFEEQLNKINRSFRIMTDDYA